MLSQFLSPKVYFQSEAEIRNMGEGLTLNLDCC